MSDTLQKIKIETLETPKGNVPTVKGLETAINSVYKEVLSLDHILSKLNENITKIRSQMEEHNQKVTLIGESLADLVVHLNKLEVQQEKKNEISRRHMIIEKSDLIALKEDLSRILEQLETHVVKNHV